MENKTNIIIDNNNLLKSICKFIKNNINILAIDTEFIRKKTYFPDLCIIQIAYYYNNDLITHIIDATAKELDLKYFFNILNSKKIKKIIHSSSQDLEAFIGINKNKKINNVEDTQIMAEFCGDKQIGYSNAVSKYMNILNFEKDKKLQISDWKERPLTEKQIEYAKKDVFYLIDLYNVLYKKLEKEDKLIYYQSEMQYFLKKQNIDYFIKNSWKKLKFDIHRINYNDLELVKQLSTWRETEAIEKNISRNIIINNSILIKLVIEKPITKQSFKNNFLKYKQLLSLPRDYKKRIFNIIINHLNNIDKTNDKKIFYMYKKGFPLKNKYKKIEKIVKAISNNMNIDTELLLNQHDIISLITGSIPKREVLYGWKYALLNKYISNR